MSAAPKYLSLVQNSLLTSDLYIQLQHISIWVTDISNLMCLKLEMFSPKTSIQDLHISADGSILLGTKTQGSLLTFFPPLFLQYTSFQENMVALPLKYILDLVTSHSLHYHAGPSHHYLFLGLLRSLLCLTLALHSLFLIQGDILKTQVRSCHSAAQNSSNVLPSHPE